ncbi:hypothetical protein ACLB2K_008482 [Fragaria x ananassa]
MHNRRSISCSLFLPFESISNLPMGFLSKVSELNDRARSREKLKKNKQLQVYGGDKSEDGLRRLREKSEEISGRHEGSVTSVEVDPKQSKLTVIGYVDPNKVLHRVRHRTGKKADLWPYVRTTSLSIHTLLWLMTRRHHQGT